MPATLPPFSHAEAGAERKDQHLGSRPGGKLGLELFLVLDVNEHDPKGACPCHSDGLVSGELTKERVCCG